MKDRNQSRTAVIAALVLLAALALLVVPALLMGSMMGWAGGGMMSGYGPGWMGYGWSWVLMLLFWVLLVGGLALVIFWLFRQGYLGGGNGSSTGSRGADMTGQDRSGTGGSADGGMPALDILNQRYARGEITREMYEQMKRDILSD